MSESGPAVVAEGRSASTHRLVTCIVHKGRALPALRALEDGFGLITANINSARGVGRDTPLHQRGVGEQAEREVLTVVVDADRVDAVFEFLYFEAGIDRPHGGIVYVSDLSAASAYALPALPREA